MRFDVWVDPADEQACGLLERLAERATVTPLEYLGGTALVLGGARSGKSAWAEAQLQAHRTLYVATAEPMPEDTEWQHRVALHRQRRPAHWRTLETADLAAVLRAEDDDAVLIDCAALWLNRMLSAVGAWEDAEGWRAALEQEVSALATAVAETSRQVIIVSNEVGQGIVPQYRSGRIYRDELGRLNARLAAAVAEVWWCSAGIARRIK